MGINSFDPRTSTPKDLPYPLHRLNLTQTKVWLASDWIRREMAATLVRTRYPGGVGILSGTQLLFALVNPKGAIQELHPPFKRYEMWQVSNQPETEECPCAEFIDLEVQGPWRQRGIPGHHPFCQFDPTSNKVFNAAGQQAVENVQRGLDAQARPDEWLRLRKEFASR